MSEEKLLDREFMNKLEQLSLFSRKIFRGLLKGERRSKKKGISIEFADYKDYVPGDDLRFLDWNIYGRLERLFIKLFQEEEDLNVFFLVDSSSSMMYGQPSKFFYAKKIVAALGYIALANMDRVAVGVFSSDLTDFFPLTRGKQSAWRLFDFLQHCKTGQETDLERSCKSFALRFKGSSIVIIISDFMDAQGYEQALRFFSGPNRDVFIIHVMAQEEINPTLVGDIRLIDAETSAQTDLSISDQLLQRYRFILRGYIQELQSWCTKHDMFYLYTSNQQSFENLILKYLRQVGMLR